MLWQCLGQARPGALGAGQVRPRACCRWAWPILVLVWGAEAYGVAAMTPVFLVFLIYLFATTGGALPLPGRPVGDEPAGAELHGVA